MKYIRLTPHNQDLLPTTILFLKISNVTDQISIKFSSEGWVIFNNTTKIFVLFYHDDDHHLLRVISILHLCSVQYVTEYFDYQERVIQNSFWVHGTISHASWGWCSSCERILNDLCSVYKILLMLGSIQ